MMLCFFFPSLVQKWIRVLVFTLDSDGHCRLCSWKNPRLSTWADFVQIIRHASEVLETITSTGEPCCFVCQHSQEIQMFAHDD